MDINEKVNINRIEKDTHLIRKKEEMKKRVTLLTKYEMIRIFKSTYAVETFVLPCEPNLHLVEHFV